MSTDKGNGNSEAMNEEIKVTDRRRVDEHGEERNPQAKETVETPKAEVNPSILEAQEKAQQAMKDEADQEAKHHEPNPFEMDFPTFIMSLATQAMIDLGEAKHPETDEATVNLPLAKQTIDILAILQDKTKGNLSSAEEGLLKNALYDLRMRFVTQSRQRR